MGMVIAWMNMECHQCPAAEAAGNNDAKRRRLHAHVCALPEHSPFSCTGGFASLLLRLQPPGIIQAFLHRRDHRPGADVQGAFVNVEVGVVVRIDGVNGGVAPADEEVAAGHLLQHQRHVFGAHGGREFHDVGVAQLRGDGAPHDFGDARHR